MIKCNELFILKIQVEYSISYLLYALLTLTFVETLSVFVTLLNCMHILRSISNILRFKISASTQTINHSTSLLC